jgi:uncharacterized protein (TIGR02271 family)
MVQQEDILRSRGANLLDGEGTKVGTIEDIYLDRETNAPEWAVVKTGLLGGKLNFVPLRDASTEGNDLRVPFEKDKISGAPSIDADGQLSQGEEAELYGYYGLQYSEYRSDTGLPEGGTEGGQSPTGTGTTGDDAMTRSEEELEVGKRQREAGTARLKKYVVTEPRTETVPVQREEVRAVREPVTDANVEQATAGPDITESEHEVTLKEEEPVVAKKTVAKERIRLQKEPVTEEREVSEEVRKEQIETEGEVRR